MPFISGHKRCKVHNKDKNLDACNMHSQSSALARVILTLAFYKTHTNVHGYLKHLKLNKTKQKIWGRGGGGGYQPQLIPITKISFQLGTASQYLHTKVYTAAKETTATVLQSHSTLIYTMVLWILVLSLPIERLLHSCESYFSFTHHLVW